MILFFDTETNGKLNFNLPSDAGCQPDLVQLAACLMDEKAECVYGQLNFIIEPPDPERAIWITEELTRIHGISDNIARCVGQPRRTALSAFNHMCRHSDTLIAHNIDFDYNIMLTAYLREGVPHRMGHLQRICTMHAATPVLKLPKPGGWRPRKPGDEKYKWPTLTECHQSFFGQGFDGAHNAMNDVMALVAVWRELRKIRAL